MKNCLQTALVYLCVALVCNLVVATYHTLAAGSNYQFAKAEPGYKYFFPRDHWAHGQFATEWWYYTGNLFYRRGGKTQRLGYQLTFFRVGIDRDRSVYAAHFALSDVAGKKFNFFEIINQDYLQAAGASEGTVWNKNWSAEIEKIPSGVHRLKARREGITLDLVLRPSSPIVVQGLPGEGISRKGACPSCASHYYSIPNMRTSGTVIFDGEIHRVRGSSWMDHEFGSSQLQEDQEGWDWFSINFDDGSSLMLYSIRQDDGTRSKFSSGSYLTPAGERIHLAAEDFALKPTKSWLSPHSGARYPLVWEVTVPKANLGLKILPALTDQELRTELTTTVNYWEGAINVIDRAKSKQVGVGYMELTGYDGRMKQRF